MSGRYDPAISPTRRAEIVELAAAAMTGLLAEHPEDPGINLDKSHKGIAIQAVKYARAAQLAIDDAEGDTF